MADDIFISYKSERCKAAEHLAAVLMTDNAKQTGPAVEAHYQFRLARALNPFYRPNRSFPLDENAVS
jgi:hypothetical protein